VSRVPAITKVPRLLAIVAWVAAQEGGVPVDVVCGRFGISRAHLLAALNTVMLTGVPPYTPDSLVTVFVDDDLVRIEPQWLDRPLALTAAQGLALMGAAEGLHDVPGSEPDGPLARAMHKLAGAVRARPGSDVDVHLGSVGEGVLPAIEQALADGTAVLITYHSANADRTDKRTIEPWVLRAVDGAWQVDAWCRDAGGVRTFRLDRMLDVVATGEAAVEPRGEVEAPGYRPGPDDVPVTLVLEPEVAWVVERWAVEDLEELEDGRLRVRLQVGAAAWLQRTLLALGPRVEVISAGDPTVVDLRPMAERILARYGR
jgi:proteasome accessory factor C